MSTATEHATEQAVELTVPRQFAVVMLNDDFTPMDFVVEVLRAIFDLPENLAEKIMLAVHIQGQAVVGTYSKEVAETKVFLAKQAAESDGHPFMCQMRPV